MPFFVFFFLSSTTMVGSSIHLTFSIKLPLISAGRSTNTQRLHSFNRNNDALAEKFTAAFFVLPNANDGEFVVCPVYLHALRRFSVDNNSTPLAGVIVYFLRVIFSPPEPAV